MSINLPICRQNNHKLCNEYMTDHASINQMIFFQIQPIHNAELNRTLLKICKS